MNATDTDHLTQTREILVSVLTKLGVAHHDHEPKSLGEVPAAWLGRPVLSYDGFEHEVVVDWPLTFAGHPVDPSSTTDYFLREIWELWGELLGPRVMADSQVSVQAVEARPSVTTIGDDSFPTYDIAVRTTVHVTC